MIDEGACRAGASPRPQRSHCRTRQEKETGHNQRVILHEVTSRNLLSLRCHFSLTQQAIGSAFGGEIFHQRIGIRHPAQRGINPSNRKLLYLVAAPVTAWIPPADHGLTPAATRVRPLGR